MQVVSGSQTSNCSVQADAAQGDGIEQALRLQVHDHQGQHLAAFQTQG